MQTDPLGLCNHLRKLPCPTGSPARSSFLSVPSCPLPLLHPHAHVTSRAVTALFSVAQPTPACAPSYAASLHLFHSVTRITLTRSLSTCLRHWPAPVPEQLPTGLTGFLLRSSPQRAAPLTRSLAPCVGAAATSAVASPRSADIEIVLFRMRPRASHNKIHVVRRARP